jgi:hypothetical protein
VYYFLIQLNIAETDMRKYLYALLLLVVILSPSSSDATTRSHHTYAHRTHRSTAAKNAFKRLHPCPANGRRSGSCPGYVIDHVKPLMCGGPDNPSNMQWQTVADGKAKDKIERYCR